MWKKGEAMSKRPVDEPADRNIADQLYLHSIERAQAEIQRKKLSAQATVFLQKHDKKKRKFLRKRLKKLQPGNAKWLKAQEKKREKRYEAEALLRGKRHDATLVEVLGPAWSRKPVTGFARERR
jgi:hypothetical protein